MLSATRQVEQVMRPLGLLCQSAEGQTAQFWRSDCCMQGIRCNLRDHQFRYSGRRPDTYQQKSGQLRRTSRHPGRMMEMSLYHKADHRLVDSRLLLHASNQQAAFGFVLCSKDRMRCK